MFSEKSSIFLVVLAGLFCCSNANAQLWSYIGWTPAKEKAFEKRLKKEAYKVVTHYTPDADKFPYDEMIYRLQSLDSTFCYVHVMEEPFTRILSIKCTADSLKIEDCQGFERLHFLRKNLFEIVYTPRGGSDDGYNNVLLLAVRNGKFCITMEVETMHDYDGPGFFGLNETNLKLAGPTPPDYRLTLTNHDLRRYDKKSKNFDNYHTYLLKYDNKLDVFYNSYSSVSGYIYSDSENKQQISGTYPVIKLGNAKYCYIKDCWYAIGLDYENNKITLWNFCHRPQSKI